MENSANLAREQAIVQERWEAVWDRVRAGRHTVVIGVHTLPPAPRDLQVLRVHCEASGTSGGALEAARRKVEQLLGEELLSPESGREPFETGLRHRFLGDMPRPSIEVRLVEACNRLATWPEGRVVLAFEAIDVADEATVKTLAQMLQRPGWLRLPLLFTMRGAPQGLVTELLYLLCHEEGNAVVIEMASDGTLSEVEAPGDWSALPPDILRILRAGSVLGSTFEAELVARLLNEPLSTILEKL